MILTVDKNFGRCLQLLSLSKCSVPYSASVYISIIFFGRTDRQDWLGWFIFVSTSIESWIDWLGLTFNVPINLRRGWTSKGCTGQVQGSSLSCRGCCGWDGGLWWLEQYCQLDGLWVKFVSGSALLHPTFKLTVVTIVSGLPYPQVVDPCFWKVFNSENKEIR